MSRRRLWSIKNRVRRLTAAHAEAHRSIDWDSDEDVQRLQDGARLLLEQMVRGTWDQEIDTATTEEWQRTHGYFAVRDPAFWPAWRRWYWVEYGRFQRPNADAVWTPREGDPEAEAARKEVVAIMRRVLLADRDYRYLACILPTGDDDGDTEDHDEPDAED